MAAQQLELRRLRYMSAFVAEKEFTACSPRTQPRRGAVVARVGLGLPLSSSLELGAQKWALSEAPKRDTDMDM